jgi:hypothetical protein
MLAGHPQKTTNYGKWAIRDLVSRKMPLCKAFSDRNLTLAGQIATLPAALIEKTRENLLTKKLNLFENCAGRPAAQFSAAFID